MQGIFVLALFFSPAALAGYGQPLSETPLAILLLVVVVLLAKAKVR